MPAWRPAAIQASKRACRGGSSARAIPTRANPARIASSRKHPRREQPVGRMRHPASGPMLASGAREPVEPEKEEPSDAAGPFRDARRRPGGRRRPRLRAVPDLPALHRLDRLGASDRVPPLPVRDPAPAPPGRPQGAVRPADDAGRDPGLRHPRRRGHRGLRGTGGRSRPAPVGSRPAITRSRRPRISSSCRSSAPRWSGSTPRCP